ncbi:O-antigen ligase family protein [Trichlorobacter ammonificans]|uniref:O-antigen ligase-related domain-containing protein n=1 Tax=Trichlorobacter ammonificans TaxID=2916410 RepID=A0ABM9D852_9BACT|nr:O-antigen ligase family protein [Trichlorobacter ammonificans]CAH2031395.1 conserved membrane protein of unknown function [Trichlorobacter ammonificans]
MRELILLILVLVSLPLVLKRPLWALTIYLGATVIRPEMLFWGGTSGSYVFMVYYLATLVGLYLRGELLNVGRVLQREFLLMLWMLGAILLSIELAQYPVFREYYYFIELLKGFLLCGCLYLLVKDFDDFRKIQVALLCCFAFLAVWGIDQHFRGNERLEGLGGSAWGDSNGVAATFILFLPAALALVFTAENRKQFWSGLGIAALMVALIICTKSRSGLIGLAVALAMFGYYSRNMFRIARIAVILMVVALPFATQQYLERMNTMTGEGGFEQSARDRMAMWQAGLLIFADNPLVGTGFLTFPEAKMRYQDHFQHLDEEFRASLFRVENKKVTHNTYIQLLADTGLLGALPFCLLVAGGIVLGLKARRLLAGAGELRRELLWISGLCAGIAGFAVCILSIDAAMSLELYVQLILASILYRITMERLRGALPKTTPLGATS